MKGFGFGALGFRVQSSGLRALGFGVCVLGRALSSQGLLLAVPLKVQVPNNHMLSLLLA